MKNRAFISKAALRKLPAKADDGSPYCPQCRRYGELNQMISTGLGDSLECEAWSRPIYTDSDRLTHEQLIAGEPCRGCGQELLALTGSPSWVSKGTMFFSDQERSGHPAEEQAFQQRHPSCHALRWRMQGSGVSHCARCCPPPPMSPERAQRISEILVGAAERRVRQARREGATYDSHALERRLSGRARPLSAVRREYEQHRAQALKDAQPEVRALLRSSFPDPELMYRWRMQLGCGDIVEVLTLGDDRPVTEVNWSWAGGPLRAGRYHCVAHQAEETPYRRVCRYLNRATLDLAGDDKLAQKPETVGYWTVRLECGHLENQITPLDWNPRDGHRQTAPNDPAEVARRKARIKQVEHVLGAMEYAHAVRRIEQGHLQPDPMTTCETCRYEQPVVAFQRVGWLVPADPAMATPTAVQAASRPTRTQLEKRVADLEAEVARLKDRQRE